MRRSLLPPHRRDHSSPGCRLVALLALAVLVAACGGGSKGSSPPPPPPAPPTLELLAGSIGGYGNLDGNGRAARFSSPSGIAIGSDGTLYVADTDNRTIRRITPAGGVSTMAGRAGFPGIDDGTGATARFMEPVGIAVDGAGSVYVTDHATIRKVTAGGAVSTLAGVAQAFGYADGTGADARFGSPTGIAMDSAGNLYVADTVNATIRKVTPQGVVTTLAGATYSYPDQCLTADGAGAAARFCWPFGIAVDGTGIVYVTDAGSHLVRKITTDGLVTTLAGTPNVPGSADGIGSAASFNRPGGIAVDGAGRVYVADNDNHTIRAITPTGLVTTLAGVAGVAGFIDGTVSSAGFSYPEGLAVDGAGTLYVAELGNDTVRKIKPDGTVTTIAGAAIESESSDGAGNGARFYASRFGPITGPAGVAAAADGNVYVADTGNQTIRKISPGGAVTTIAGSPAPPPASSSGCQYSAGTGALAHFCVPQGIAVDRAGVVYVADTGNFVIRRISPDGAATTLAGGPGIPGLVDGVGGVARFSNPQGIAIDLAGTLYVADGKTVRSVSPQGLVTTIAGSTPPPCNAPGTTCASYCPDNDGVGADALFCDATDVAIGDDALVWVADRRAVRRIAPGGVVTTIDTAGYYSNDASKGLARPTGIAVDDRGSVYVADGFQHQVFQVSSQGALTPVIGTADAVGTALGALPASLMNPSALAIGSAGQLLLVDGGAILYTRGR